MQLTVAKPSALISALVACSVALAAGSLVGGAATCRSDEALTVAEAAAEQLAAKLAERDRLWSQARKLAVELKFTEAIAAAQRVMALESEIFGPQHDEVAGTLKSIGQWSEALGEFPAAIAAYERRATMLATLSDAPVWKVEDARRELADCRQLLELAPQQQAELRHARALAAATPSNQDATPKAIESLREVLAIRQRLLGEDNLATAKVRHDLGVLLRESEDYAAAKSELEAALAVRRQALGEEHPDTANSLYELGMALKFMGDFAAARPLYEQALAIRRKVLGESDPWVAQSLSSLGGLHEALKEYEAAQSYFEQALATYIAAYGEQHENTATTLSWLGYLAEKRGDLAAARSYHERALAARRKILGDEHLDTALSFHEIGHVLRLLKDYPAALPNYERVLAIRRQNLGEQHDLTVISSINLGLLLTDLKKYDEARPYLERALEISLKQGGENCARTAEALDVLASLNEATKDLAAAKDCYERVLAIRREILGAQHPETLDAIASLGWFLKKSGDYAAARPLLEELLATQRTVLGKDHPDVAETLSRLAIVANDSGDLAAARRCYEQALAIRRRTLGEDHDSTATAKENLGIHLTEIGEFPAARLLLEQTLADARRLHGEEHAYTAGALNSLGSLLCGMGDDRAAQPLFEQSIAIFRVVLPADDPGLSDPLTNLGGLLGRAGQFKAARATLEEALQIIRKNYGEIHPKLAVAWNNLGWACKGAGDLKKAKACYERSLAIARATLGDEHPTTALALTNLGCTALAAGDDTSAYFREALAIYRKTLSQDHPELPRAIKNMAGAEATSGRYEAAAKLVWEAAEIERRSLERQLTSLSDQKMLLLLKRLSPTFDIFASLPIDAPSHRQGLAEMLLSRKAMTFEVLNRRRQAETTAAADPQLIGDRERLAAARHELERLATLPPEDMSGEQLAARRRELAGEIERLEARLANQLARLLGDDFSLGVALDDVRDALPPGAALVEFVQFQRFNYQERNTDAPSYAAVVIAAGEVTNPDRVVAFIDLGPAAEIDALVSDLSAQVHEYQRGAGFIADEASSEQSYREVAAKLYAKLLAPLEESLGGAKQLYLGPDSRLHEIPFEALVDASGKYLIEAGYQFAYVNSGRDLVRERSKGSASGVYVFAGPNYDLDADARLAAAERLQGERPTLPAATATADSQLLAGAASAVISRSADTRLGWRHLPGADLEGQEAAAAFAGADWGEVHAYTGDEAVEDLVKTVRRPRALVLVTHGDFLEDEPELSTDSGESRSFGELGFERGFSDSRGGAGQARAGLRATEDPMLRSYLLLAGANKIDEPLPAGAKLDNGWLTALEISQLDLQGTDLVVLSACNTGRGRAENGQAVTGMRSAFLFAGARTIVGSLYEVPNAETRQLLKPFYEGVAAGQGKLASLNAAKLDFIAKRRQATGAAHPFYWASFVLVGER